MTFSVLVYANNIKIEEYGSKHAFTRVKLAEYFNPPNTTPSHLPYPSSSVTLTDELPEDGIKGWVMSSTAL